MTTTNRSLGAPDPSALERVLRQDRLILVGALAIIVAIAWVWLVFGAGTGMSAVGMTRRSGMPDVGAMMMQRAVWTPSYAGLMFAMWWVMMVAMMLPSAAPMLLLFARLNRNEKAGDRPYVPTAIFAAGYLVGVGRLQRACHRPAVGLGAGGFAVADDGDDQLLARWHDSPPRRDLATHAGEECLPAALPLVSEFPGAELAARHWGAWRMGVEHGSYCLGCCWFLMGLLFFGGIMNLFWIAGLSAFVLLEKTIPRGDWLARAAGVAATAGGVAMLASAAAGA